MLAITVLLCTLKPLKGSSLYFQGDNQVAVVPFQRVMNAPEMTLEAWIKLDPTAIERYYNYIVCRNYGDFGIGLAIHGRPIKVFSQAPALKVPMNTWTHVAVVCSRRAMKFYVNGNLAAAAERTGPLREFEHRLMIGNSDMSGEPGHQPTPFRGWISELRLWSEPHTQSQIRRTMNRYLRGNEIGLLGYFPMVEGSGQILHDYTGRLISASLGEAYTPGDDDPTWSQDSPPLSGRKPRLR